MGGLATGLGSFHRSHSSLWIGWPGIDSERIRGEEEDIAARLQPENCHPVFLSQSDVEDYYHGFCNKTIWPLFHYFTEHAVYGEKLWEAYKRVNNNFCDAVIEVAEPDDIIWIHDYQLMLVLED